MPSTSPVLEITDGKGNFLEAAPFVVLSTMFHPDDSTQRALYLEASIGKLRIDSDAPILRQEAIKAAAAAAQFETVIDRASYSGYGITVSGDLLLFIVNAALHSPRDASLSRAIQVWCADQARGKTHEGRPVAASPRSVKAAWSRFKSVAHLCGAWLLSQKSGEPKWDPTNPETLLNFLAIAEVLREFGEAHRPPSGRTGSKRSRTSTLDPETTWKIPPDLKLPPGTIFVPPLTKYAEEFLRHYRAE